MGSCTFSSSAFSIMRITQSSTGTGYITFQVLNVRIPAIKPEGLEVEKACRVPHLARSFAQGWDSTEVSRMGLQPCARRVGGGYPTGMPAHSIMSLVIIKV